MTQTISFSKLKIEINESIHEVSYRFVGDVDETFKHEDVPRITRKKILFELAQVNDFNSCGIREWIYLVRDISKLGQLVFKECSVTMIDQINMVPDSLGNGHIESFFAPYYCESSGCVGEVNRLINIRESAAILNNKSAPEFHCEKCKKQLEFDALEESYFLFIDNKNLSKAG